MKKKLQYFIPFILQNISWFLVRPLLNFFVHFNTYGLEKLEGIDGPIIFAVNHTSEIDPILVPAALPLFSRFSPVFYVSRKSYLDSITGFRKYFYGGLFFKAWGAYPTYSGVKDYNLSLQNHIGLLEDGHSVCIFPEGRISKNGELGKIHGGLGYLYCNENVSIAVVNISGAFKISIKDFLYRKRVVSLEIRNVLAKNTEKCDSKSIEEYRALAESIMKNELPY